MLTRKQHELLRFIQERLRESGVPPSFDEMKDALDLRSKSGIHRLITALVERGFIRRLPHRPQLPASNRPTSRQAQRRPARSPRKRLNLQHCRLLRPMARRLRRRR